MFQRHAAEPGAEEAADLVREQGQAEQRAQVARAEQLADQAGGGRHRGQPAQAQAGGEQVEGQCARRRQQVQHDQQCAAGVHRRQDPLHPEAFAELACCQASGDVEQADQGDGGRRDTGGQSAQRDLAGQVGDQEGDVHATGEEAQVQHPVAAIAQGDRDLLFQRDTFLELPQSGVSSIQQFVPEGLLAVVEALVLVLLEFQMNLQNYVMALPVLLVSLRTLLELVQIASVLLPSQTVVCQSLL